MRPGPTLLDGHCACRLVALFWAVALAGCALPNPDPPMVESVRWPERGTEQSVSVGESMMVLGDRVLRPSVLLRERVSVGPLTSYTLLPGYYYRQGGVADKAYYRPEQSPEGGDIIKAPFADPVRAIRFLDDRDSVCVETILRVSVCERLVGFKRLLRPQPLEGHRVHKLFYQGRVGDRLRLVYEAPIAGAGAPLDRLDLDYDLSRSDTIRFRGLSFKILEADNQAIRYILTSEIDAFRGEEARESPLDRPGW